MASFAIAKGFLLLQMGKKTAAISKNYPLILEGSLSLVHNCEEIPFTSFCYGVVETRRG